MPLQNSLADREYDKFEDTVDGTAVRTSIVGGTITGEFVPSGLLTAGRVTEVVLNNTTWTALPATVLADRNGLGIQNYSGQEIKINFDPSVVGYVGIMMADQTERFYDTRIPVYAKSSTSTCTVVVEELS